MKMKYIKLLSIGICLSLGVGALVVWAQKEKQIRPQDKTKMEFQEDQGIFRRISSTETDADEGFSIAAIRRVNVRINSAYDEEPENQTIKQLVEIELFAKFLPSGTNMPDVVQIGDRTFPPFWGYCENNANCVKVIMSADDFDKLKDNSLVTLYKGMPMNSDVLKELYKNGEPKEVVGAKFGRLNKKKIDEFPVIERKND